MPEQTPLEGKLLVILRTLTKKETKKFRTYICSPFFNTNTTIIHFFDLLMKNYPAFQELTKETLFFAIFPEKQQYEDIIFRTLLADLTKLVKGFLALLKYKQDWKYEKQKLLEELLERQLLNLFQKEWKAVVKKHQQNSQQDFEFLFHEFKFRSLIDVYTVIYHNRGVRDSGKEVIDALDNYYVASKLKYSAAILNQKKIINVNHDLKLLEEVLASVKQNTFAQVPIIQVYYHVIILLKELSYLAFCKAKNCLLEHLSALPTDEIRHVCTMLINYCIWQKLATNDKKYTLEIFELYKLMLEHNVLYVNKHISPHNFRNIVNLGLELKKFEWVEGFIKFFRAKIHPTYEDNIYHFSMAAFYFAQKDYQATAKVLAKIQFEFEFIDFYYHIEYKTLMIRNYYELNPISEELEYALEAFRMYLRKNRTIKSNQRKGYENFIKLTKKLVNKKRGKKRTVNNLKAEIEATKPLVCRIWLLEKIA